VRGVVYSTWALLSNAAVGSTLSDIAPDCQAALCLAALLQAALLQAALCQAALPQAALLEAALCQAAASNTGVVPPLESATR
jgi:hypothetical protein